MILETAIINITSKLEDICDKDGQAISSHTDIKEKGLGVLLSLVQKAPTSEYRLLLQSDRCEIILGFLLHVLCRLAKDDRSREIRARSLEVMEALLENLARLHPPTVGPLQPQPTEVTLLHPSADTATNLPTAPASHQPTVECSIRSVIIAMPGVTSALFKIIVEDIKAPKHLLISAIRTLSKYLSVAFLECRHESTNDVKDLLVKLEGPNLITTCDNLAVRIGYLVSYISTHQDVLPKEVLQEVLKLFQQIVKIPRPELLSRSLKSIIRYTALINSTVDTFGPPIRGEIQLQLMLIIDNIKASIQQQDNSSGEQLDSVIYSSVYKILDKLDEQGLNMLMSERYSELTMLSGLLMLLPEDTLTCFLELDVRRRQLMRIFTRLTEFKTHQPLLFLTNTTIDDKALESRHRDIYTIEKQFAHLEDKEVKSINECCQIIGRNSDWPFLNDLFKMELVDFSTASNLFITNLLMKACLQRENIGPNPYKFASHMIDCYIDKIQEDYTNLKMSEGEIFSSDILKLVLAIETLSTLIEIHLKFNSSNQSQCILILKDLLCPLLNWCSSSSRAISEAALNTVSQISLMYGFNSVNSLIEQNLDYIVDGCSRKLNNFACNTEVTNVLAITFKLSSIETFYYFNDIYEKIFRLLAAYHFTDKSKPIALLFYRTLNILCDWKEAMRGDTTKTNETMPLTTNEGITNVLHELDIDRRIEKLRHDQLEAQEIDKQMENFNQIDEEKKTVDEIINGRVPVDDRNNDEKGGDEEMRAKSADILLAEKIIHQCIGLMSSHIDETKIFALKTVACGFKLLKDHEDTLLPLVHQVWSVLASRLKGDYKQNLEVNLCAFECLISMASSSKDFIKDRTLREIIPKLCHFLEFQASQSKGRKDYDAYCMTLAFKCQLSILHNIGQLAYHIELNYDCLWRIIRVAFLYLDSNQVGSLREASKRSLNYMMALDADCVWYYGKQANQLDELPFARIFVL